MFVFSENFVCKLKNSIWSKTSIRHRLSVSLKILRIKFRIFRAIDVTDKRCCIDVFDEIVVHRVFLPISLNEGIIYYLINSIKNGCEIVRFSSSFIFLIIKFTCWHRWYQCAFIVKRNSTEQNWMSQNVFVCKLLKFSDWHLLSFYYNNKISNEYNVFFRNAKLTRKILLIIRISMFNFKRNQIKLTFHIFIDICTIRYH